MLEDRIVLAILVGPVDEPDAVVRRVAITPLVCVGSRLYFEHRAAQELLGRLPECAVDNADKAYDADLSLCREIVDFRQELDPIIPAGHDPVFVRNIVRLSRGGVRQWVISERNTEEVWLKF
jgi:hypothetical protein